MKSLFFVSLMVAWIVVSAPSSASEDVQAGNTTWKNEWQDMDMKEFCFDLTTDSGTDLECSYESSGDFARLMFIGPEPSTMQENRQFISTVSIDFCRVAASKHPMRDVVFIDQTFSYFVHNNCRGDGFRELTPSEVNALISGSSNQAGIPLVELKASCREMDDQSWVSCDLDIGRDTYQTRVAVANSRAASILIDRFEGVYFRMLCQSAYENGFTSGLAIITAERENANYTAECKDGVHAGFFSEPN